MAIPRDNPARTAAVLRELIAGCRAEGHAYISLDQLEIALDRLETNDWKVVPNADTD